MKTHSDPSTSTAPKSTLFATEVPPREQSRFWPQHFGNIPQWFTLEPRVFGWLDRLCDDYHGGQWAFYTLSNGGAFLIPDTEKASVLLNPLNGNGGNRQP